MFAHDGPVDLDDALRRAQRGEEDGFAVLFRALQPRLLRYLRLRTNDAWQDVASDTWVRVVADLHKFRGDADDFAAWVFTIARYRATDAARAAARAPQQLPDEFDVVAGGIPVDVAVADDLALADLLRAVRDLTPDQADAVFLRHVAGLDVATIARILGKTPTAVRINCHRGLRRLAAVLPNPYQPAEAVS